MENFGYTGWVLDNFVYLILLIVPISFYVIYNVLKEERKIFYTISTIIITLAMMFVVLPSILFTIFLGSYIEGYREEFKGYMGEQVRSSYEIENVEVTNNNGNYIPKFSKKDKDRYVKIEYEVNEDEDEKIVNYKPIKEDSGAYKLSYVILESDYEVELKGISNLAVNIREFLGIEDRKRLQFEKGAYDFRLGVPEEDYEDRKSEMRRKSK